MCETLCYACKIISVTIARVANRCFVSIIVDLPDSSHLLEAAKTGRSEYRI